ncbi:hypothetical protein SK128_022691 [Halocaridina rubra]|uniref:Uncharacterized protein n=1 Tax=Halocaridina rubra TaxID=373956 RepID=A0AAN8ZSJ6_HALRR
MAQEVLAKCDEEKIEHNGFLFAIDKAIRADSELQFWRCKQKKIGAKQCSIVKLERCPNKYCSCLCIFEQDPLATELSLYLQDLLSGLKIHMLVVRTEEEMEDQLLYCTMIFGSFIREHSTGMTTETIKRRQPTRVTTPIQQPSYKPLSSTVDIRS